MIDSTFDESDETVDPGDHFQREPPPQPLDSNEETVEPSASQESALEENAEAVEWLIEEDFEESEDFEPYVRYRPPGPGLIEAGVWSGGVLVVQLIGGIIVLFGLMIAKAATDGPKALPKAANQIEAALAEHMPLFIGGSLGFFVLVAILATRLRLGPEVLRRLSLRSVSLRHLVPTVLLVLPMALLSGQIAWWFTPRWNALMKRIPQLAPMEKHQAVNEIAKLAEQTPLWLLILIIAVAPAIAEELVFRGVVGRGLLARRGLVVGVALTSALFVMTHMHPVQVVSLIPLSIALHLLYLGTRSFWIPMLVHFLNNSLVAVVMKFPPEDAVEGIGEDGPLSLPLLLSVIACVIFVLHYIWRTRVEFALPDGTWWTPGYATAESPPASAMAIARHRSVAAVPAMLAVLALGAFYLNLGLQMAAAAKP